MQNGAKRGIRIGNCSGGIGDGPKALYRLATEGPIDAITADYLAEVNLGNSTKTGRSNVKDGDQLNSKMILRKDMNRISSIN